MTEALYFLDCYLKEFEATVEKVTDDKFVVLDRTAFYPESGGQPSDTGKLVRESDGAEFDVLYAGKFNGEISHEIAGENVSDRVKSRGQSKRIHRLGSPLQAHAYAYSNSRNRKRN